MTFTPSSPLTYQAVANKILAYLHHELPLAELMAWCASAAFEAPLMPGTEDVLTPILMRLGVSDVEAFSLSWEEWEAIMRQLSYRLEVMARQAA